MNLQHALLFLSMVLLPLWANAQRIDHPAALRTAGDSYVRFHYDNDFLARAKTDRYYTQGYSLEVVAPALSKNPLSKLLIQYRHSPVTHGVALEHFGFTPTSIQSNELLSGDRPFAGVILLKSRVSSVDTLHRQRLSATLSMGMIGPAAFAGRMQATIHRWSGDRKPNGWQYQIGNDVVINYDLLYEKEVLNLAGVASLTTQLLLRAGTLANKAQAGLTLTTGLFDDPFSAADKKRTLHLFAYAQPQAALVAYDATLQGGVFNRNNPYTLPASQLNRLTFQANAGVVARLGKLYVEYYQSYLSAEFRTGREHSWGGVKIGVGF